MSGKPEIVVGVELGPQLIQAVAFSTVLMPVGKARRTTKSQRGPAAVMDRIAQCVRDAVDESDHELASVRALGLAFPGRMAPGSPPVNFSDTPGWDSPVLEAELTHRLGFPAFAGNTDDLRACAAWCRDLGRSPGTVVVLFWGNTFGGGLLREGKLAEKSGEPAFHALIDSVSQGWTQRLPPEWRGKSDRELRKAFKRSDPMIRAFVEDAIAVIGRTVADLHVSLAPAAILVGSAIMEERRGPLLEAIRQKACVRLGEDPGPSMKLVASELGDQAALLGAADLALSQSESKTGAPSQPMKS